MRPNPIPVIAALLLLSLSLTAQDESRYQLLLKSGSFIPQKNITADKLNQFNREAARTVGKTFAVLQFENIPTTAERQQLKEAGIELLEYIPHNAYTVTITGSLKARAVVELSPEQKMQPELAKGTIPAWAVKVAGTIDIWVSFPKSFIYETIAKELKDRNFDIISTLNKEYRIIALRIATTRLGELSSLPFIEYVQPIPHEDQSLNYNSMALSKANILRGAPGVGGRNLNGSGVVVGIGDNGDVQAHLDFSNRLINRAAESMRAHATHVTGTIGGAGIIQELYTGYAPKATLLTQVFSNIFAYAPTYVQDYGMVITNNSFGSVVSDCIYSGFYDLTSRILDQQAIDLPELQQVFAAGNDGGRTCSPYPFGFKTVLGGYQSSKNVLTVGSTNYKGDLSGFSSKGPVKDGRIKPEIMSQGQIVLSTWANNALYASNNGTSMAAPGISGGLALLIQRYRQLHGGSNPKNGLLKALICNGGTDRGNDGPDYSYGFGSMNLLRSVTMMESTTYFNTSVANTANNTHVVAVPANTAQLKVTLYWQDPPATLLATKTLVNDLDLNVTTPSSSVVLPRVLDTIPANVTAVAGNGVDHINNIEQIVINNPAAGNYSLKVTGTAITQNPSQEYFLVYDIIPESLQLTYPIGNEHFIPSVNPFDSVHVQWDTYGGASSQFALDLSTDNGSTWAPLSPSSSNISSNSRLFSWGVPDIQTEKAKIRLTKISTGETKISSAFTVITQPIDSLTPNQCEGYITLGWRNVPGATDYEVMMHRGDEMVPVATTALLNYTFSGLSKDSVYWVTVRPRINGIPGRRAHAVSRQPNSGTCTGSISDNDLKVDSILSPLSSGRKFTSTELTGNVPVTIRIKNLDDVVSTDDIVVTYVINGGAAITETINGTSTPTSTIAAGGFIDYTFSINANLVTAGTYSFEVTATKATDPVAANNKLTKVVKQLDNQPITIADIPWLDNFESAPVQSVIKTQMGLDGRDRYDFVNSTINGRVRTFINSGIAYSGSKAVTLDADRFVTAGNTDSLTGTFNLATFNAATKDLRFDFRYKNHGQLTNAANKVWIRSNDAGSWIEVYDLFANQNIPGSFKRSSSIELSNILLANATNFSSSFQVRFGQNGKNQATDNDGGAGYTFDDIRIYEVQNDMQILSVDEPAGYNCALTATVPIKVSVRNGSSTIINNIPVKYRINGGAFVNETIASVAANTTIQYTFTTTADLSAIGSYTIESIVSYPGDSFAENDTAIVSVTNLPVVSSFPYLQNFELNNGSWYTLGSRNSWEYGTPVSPKINRAASGSKAWKTRLVGYYNDAELSYLYSPCFDISAMTNPTLSFSLSLDIEDCGSTLCDAAWVEYSSDGISWTKLGSTGQGTNWYNKNYAGNQLWSQQDYIRWHVASTALPTSNNSRLRLRFVFSSDPGLSKDGIAVDDIHIYDNTFGIYDVTGASPVVNQSAVSGTNWINFVESGTNKLIASINPNGQNLGNTNVQSFVNTSGVRIKNSQYYHDRNITVKPTNVSLSDSATVRFYFLDTETEALINATGCGVCYKPSTAYDLGVSKFSHPDDNLENGTIADNNGSGTWLFISSPKATKIPFDKGYYAEFKVKDFSEFWLNNGGFDNLQPLPVQLLSFTAAKKANTRDVAVQWKTASEFNVNRFEVEVAKGNAGYQQGQFVKVGDVNSLGNSVREQQYDFTDIESGKSGVRYYRLKIIDNDGSVTYSAIRSVVFDDEIKWQINPNPSAGKFSLTYQAADGLSISGKVYDVNGKLVKLFKSVATGFIQKFNIDLEEPSFANGLYLLEVIAGDKKQSFKLIKQ
jgi:hypothetical protein